MYKIVFNHISHLFVPYPTFDSILASYYFTFDNVNFQINI